MQTAYTAHALLHSPRLVTHASRPVTPRHAQSVPALLPWRPASSPCRLAHLPSYTPRRCTSRYRGSLMQICLPQACSKPTLALTNSDLQHLCTHPPLATYRAWCTPPSLQRSRLHPADLHDPQAHPNTSQWVTQGCTMQPTHHASPCLTTVAASSCSITTSGSAERCSPCPLFAHHVLLPLAATQANPSCRSLLAWVTTTSCRGKGGQYTSSVGKHAAAILGPFQQQSAPFLIRREHAAPTRYMPTIHGRALPRF